MIKPTPVLIPALMLVLSASAQIANPPTTSNPQTTPTAAPADPPMPKDPNALMQLAARVNGLGSPDMKPWHLKANYQTFDADGKPKEQGVFEEWWASPEKYKISYTSPSFNQVQYRNGEKFWKTGDSGWVPFRDDMVEQYLVDPLRMAADTDKVPYTIANRQLGKVSLVCAGPDASRSDKPVYGETFCFDDDKPILRVEQSSVFALFNDIIRIENHYIDKQILVEDSTHPILKVDVTTLEFLNTFDGSMLEVPASAPSEEHPTVKGGVMAGRKIGGEDIRYPMAAKSERVQGAVMLAAIISNSGEITDLEVISGPKELRRSSTDAVKTWKYTPYLMNGQPIAVRTVINVEYILGR
jgi:TonB family protein